MLRCSMYSHGDQSFAIESSTSYSAPTPPLCISHLWCLRVNFPASCMQPTNLFAIVARVFRYKAVRLLQVLKQTCRDKLYR
jgi:hypothetical protein